MIDKRDFRQTSRPLSNNKFIAEQTWLQMTHLRIVTVYPSVLSNIIVVSVHVVSVVIVHVVSVRVVSVVSVHVFYAALQRLFSFSIVVQDGAIIDIGKERRCHSSV